MISVISFINYTNNNISAYSCKNSWYYDQFIHFALDRVHKWFKNIANNIKHYNTVMTELNTTSNNSQPINDK